MLKILITGCTGQLGRSIHFLSPNYKNIQFTFINTKIVDLTKKNQIYNFFKNYKFDFIINCAAYTNVDAAEINKKLNYTINAESVKIIAQETNKQNSTLIHISTDYVFDGISTIPYLPEDITNPINEYGKAKLLGEKNALKYNMKSIIIRTSWLYSPYGNNFVKSIKKIFKHKKEIYIVGNQTGSPTLTYDLATTILKIINTPKKQYGIYHYSNSNYTNWFEFACEIKKEIEKNKLYKIKTKKIHKINMNQYQHLAKRPIYSVLNLNKIQKDYSSIKIYHWKSSLKKIINKI